MFLSTIKKVIAATSLTLLSSSLLAIPTYDGNTVGNPGVRSEGAGYYIWSNETQDSWSVRWTGIDAAVERVNWWGEFLFRDNLGTEETVRWESNDNMWREWSQSIIFQTRTNNDGGIDGINFTLTDDMTVVDFTLGSSLAEDEYGIFIGRDAASPDTLYDVENGKHYFRASVPEPASIALIGLGLIGLGLARKKVS